MLKNVKKANAGQTDRPTDGVTYRVALHMTKKSNRTKS